MRTAQIYLDYVKLVGQGDITRNDAAEHFGVHKSTATYHLERAVAEGLLERVYSWTAHNQTGWAYRKVGTVEPMFDDYEIEAPDGDDLTSAEWDWLEYGQKEAEDDAAYYRADLETPYL